MMNKNELEYVQFKGLKIDNVGLTNIMEIISNSRHQKGYICLVEVRGLMSAIKDNRLLNAMNESLLSIADGTPLAWYGRLLGCKKIQRVAGFELMANMLESSNGFKHFLLGDTEQTISRVIEKARGKNSNLQIAGYSPPFRDQFSEQENEIIFKNINSEDPDIVWVSFGGGKQDKWMHQNINKLNRGVMVGVGAAFKFYIGDLYVPPRIVQKLGMQWFFRLMGNPRSIPKNIQYRSLFVYYFLDEILKTRKKLSLSPRSKMQR